MRLTAGWVILRQHGTWPRMALKTASCKHNMWLDMTKCRFADAALLQQLTLPSPNLLSVAHLGVLPRGTSHALLAESTHGRRQSQKSNQGPLGKVLPSWATIHTFRDLRNGPFLRGLLHESTVRRRKGCLWVPYIISAQRNSTFAGCLMSSPCKEHICSSHGGTVPLIKTFPCEVSTKKHPSCILTMYPLIGGIHLFRYPLKGCGAVWRPAGDADQTAWRRSRETQAGLATTTTASTTITTTSS